MPERAEITPVEPDPVRTGEGSELTPRCLTIATSDSGGGAGIQADLKAFAAAGCHGMTVLVALTAQNTVAVTDVHTLPPAFVRAQLDAVFDDIGVDAAKTGMLFSRELIAAVADYFAEHPVPLVVDPVMVASSGAKLLQDDAVETLVGRLFPLATVVTPNLPEARVLSRAQRDAEPEELAKAIHALGPRAVVVTGGHRAEAAIDVFFDGERMEAIEGERYEGGSAHGSGCTHSSVLAVHLARGDDPLAAARAAKRIAGEAVRNGLGEIGQGPGPVDVVGLR